MLAQQLSEMLLQAMGHGIKYLLWMIILLEKEKCSSTEIKFFKARDKLTDHDLWAIKRMFWKIIHGVIIPIKVSNLNRRLSWFSNTRFNRPLVLTRVILIIRRRSLKKICSILLICSIFIAQNLTVFANNSFVNDVPTTLENNVVSDKNVEIVLKNSSKTDDKKSTDLKEVQKDFAEDYDKHYKPSKWDITKNIAKCLGKAFINDVKSYIMFYPLFKIAQLISFLSIYLPSYAFYKKTGINIPAKVSSVFTKNENLNIIGQNLYNVIPLTLASFMFKWGKDLYLFAKS